MVVSGLCFVTVSAIVRSLGSDMSAPQASFLRYMFGLMVFLPFLFRIRHRFRLDATMGLFAMRGFVHSVAIIGWFYAMARIPVSEVTALTFIQPLFTTLGAALFFSEKLRAHRMAALAVGFLGMLVIVRPGFQEISLGTLAQLAAGPLFAASFLFTKRLTQTEDSLVIVAMLSVFCTIGLIPGAILNWRTPTMDELFWLFLVAMLATAGHFMLTQAFRNAPISVVQPLNFLQLVWAALLDVTIFQQAIDPYVIAGGAIIIFSVSYITHREHRAARRLREAPSEPPASGGI